MDTTRRSPVAQVPIGYAVTIVAQRRGISRDELLGRLATHELEVIALLVSFTRDGSLIPQAQALDSIPGADFADEVESIVSLSGWGFWNRTGIVLDGRTDRYHSGNWEELGPLGEHRLELLLALLAIGSDSTPSEPAVVRRDDDDRDPPGLRDVTTLVAAPSAPPAQAGRMLSLA